MKTIPSLTGSAVAAGLLLASLHSELRAQDGSTPPAVIAGNELSPQDQLKALSAELVAFRKTIPLEWMVKFPEPKLVQDGTKKTLHELYGKLLTFHDTILVPTDDNDKLFGQWAYAFEGVYTHRIMLEWQNFDTAWSKFRELEEKFSTARKPRNPQTQPRFVASLADTNLRLWTGAHASVLIPWIERFGMDSLADGTGHLPSWWLRDRCDYAMFLPLDGETHAQHPKKSEWLREYLTTEEEPLEVRAAFLAREITLLHTKARPEEALRLLNWWEKLHPDEFSADPSLLHKSFFVHQIGLGDRDTARTVFQRLDRLIVQGSLPPENELFRIVTQNYYRNLMLSDLEHQMNITRLSQSRNRDSK